MKGHLFKDEYKSYYNVQQLDIDMKNKMRPVCGNFGKHGGEFLNGVDFSKCYPTNLSMIDKIPVFGIYDVYKPYDGHQIEDYTCYVLRVEDDTIEGSILHSSRFCRAYGYKLNRTKSHYKLLYYKRPSKVNNFDGGFVEEHFKDASLSIEYRKFIANYCTGMLEKKYNRTRLSKVFDTYDEAWSVAEMFGVDSHRILPIHEEGNAKDIYWMVILENKASLTNGFLPIKELIYEIQRVRLYEVYHKLIENGFAVHGIKTDCLFLDADVCQRDLKHLFKFHEGVGGYKFEEGKRVPESVIEIDENWLDDVHSFERREIEIKDEYDIDEIVSKVEDVKNCGVVGVDAGTGKSTMVINYCKTKGLRCLFVCPWNTLVQEHLMNGVDAMTCSQLFGIRTDEWSKKRFPDLSDKYDVICFDEIMINNLSMLNVIYRYMRKYPDMQFFATGDEKQLEGIGEGAESVPSAFKVMFPDYINLKIIKRLDNAEDRITMTRIREDIFSDGFNMKTDCIKLCKTYGINVISDMKDMKTLKNISYFNKTAEMVSKYVFDNLYEKPKGKSIVIDGMRFIVGMNVLCKKHRYVNKSRLYTNFVYKINDIGDGFIELVEPVS